MSSATLENLMYRATDVYPGGKKVLINSGVIGGYGLCFIDEGGVQEGGGGSTTETYEYRYDEFGRQIFEREAHYSWEVWRYYAYGYGLLSRKQSEYGDPYYMHTDILGSITAVTDPSGDTLGTYAYDPFGDLLTSATNLGNWRFTGQEWDNQTDLYHFPARYYEPEWGRFLTPDPWTGMPDDKRNLVVQGYVPAASRLYTIANPNIYLLASPVSLLKQKPASLHAYVYVGNNPSNYIDYYGYAWYDWLYEIPKYEYERIFRIYPAMYKFSFSQYHQHGSAVWPFSPDWFRYVLFKDKTRWTCVEWAEKLAEELNKLDTGWTFEPLKLAGFPHWIVVGYTKYEQRIYLDASLLAPMLFGYQRGYGLW